MTNEEEANKILDKYALTRIENNWLNHKIVSAEAGMLSYKNKLLLRELGIED